MYFATTNVKRVKICGCERQRRCTYLSRSVLLDWGAALVSHEASCDAWPTLSLAGTDLHVSVVQCHLT